LRHSALNGFKLVRHSDNNDDNDDDDGNNNNNNNTNIRNRSAYYEALYRAGRLDRVPKAAVEDKKKKSKCAFEMRFYIRPNDVITGRARNIGRTTSDYTSLLTKGINTKHRCCASAGVRVISRKGLPRRRAQLPNGRG